MPTTSKSVHAFVKKDPDRFSDSLRISAHGDRQCQEPRQTRISRSIIETPIGRLALTATPQGLAQVDLLAERVQVEPADRRYGEHGTSRNRRTCS